MSLEVESQALEFTRRCRRDPYYFSSQCFEPHQRWSKQKEFHETLWDLSVKEINCKGGHSTGKTFQISESILAYFFVFQPILLILTPTLRQAKHQVWANIRDWYQKSKIPLGGELLETQLKVAPDWYALAFSTRDPNFLRGFKGKNVLLVIDEAQGIDEDLWTAIEGLLAGGTCRIIRNGNPIRSSGAYKRSFHSGRSGVKDITFSCLETPNYLEKRVVIPGLATHEWVERMRMDWGEGSIYWQALVLGDFPTIGDDNVISPEWVEACIDNADAQDGPVTLGVDVARYGHAETVIFAVRGGKLLAMKSFHGQDTMKTVGKTREMKTEVDATRIYVDVVGVGGGVVDRLIEEREPAVGVNVGMKSFDPDRFVCLRDEVWWHLRELFRTKKICLSGSIAHDEVLKNQLTSIRYEIQSSKKIKIWSKEKMKGEGMVSPDRADALALAIFASSAEHLVQVENSRVNKDDASNEEVVLDPSYEEGDFLI